MFFTTPKCRLGVGQPPKGRAKMNIGIAAEGPVPCFIFFAECRVRDVRRSRIMCLILCGGSHLMHVYDVGSESFRETPIG